MNRDRRPATFLRLDIVLILCVFGLMVLGTAFIYSSGITSDGIQVSEEWLRQIVWSVSGLILMTVFAVTDYRRLKNFAVVFYLGVIVLLVLVLVFGSYVKGARARLGTAGIGVQPSEFGKLALIVLLAVWFDERGRGLSEIRLWIGAILIATAPIVLVLLQPDLGTAFVYLPILLSIAYFGGVGWRLLLCPLVVGFILIVGVLGYAWSEYLAPAPVWFYRLFTESIFVRIILPSLAGLTAMALVGWLVFRRRRFLGIIYGFGMLGAGYAGIVAATRYLRGYQLMRLVVLLEPQVDPRGAGWHIIQSVTAVGSGGLLGKGFLRGTQSHYRYLPEQSTDFIFSILAEETGFIGSLLVFCLFAIIIVRSLYIAYISRDRFGTMVAVGITAMIGFHVIQNIGMAIGVMPITGIPLFFVSYGGSSLWTALMAIGILLSIHFRRHRY